MLIRRRRPADIWPGFVDGLAALLMVVIFMLMLFTLGQFFLSDALSGRDRALVQLNQRVAELADLLSMEQEATAELNATLSSVQATLLETTADRDALATQLQTAHQALAASERTLSEQSTRLASLSADISALQALKAELESEVSQLMLSLEDSERELGIQTELSARSTAQLELLNRQMAQLNSQLAELNGLLDVRDQQIERQASEIEDLGRRLNLALASEVRRLAEYQSEFFGRLKAALGDHPDLRVEGDRFVFQSELLFASGSAELASEGLANLRQLAATLNSISAEIPDDIDWLLRVDGHTDKRPIATSQFPSNWELSTARAIAIVKHLVSLGVAPHRLAATGFGAQHPLDARENELAYARNRRIELKLTAR